MCSILPILSRLATYYWSERIDVKVQFSENDHMGQFLQDGKNDQTLSKKKILPLHCDQTVRLFQFFSTVLKIFCPVDLKNSLVWS